MLVEVTYSVQFKATIEVPDNATPDELIELVGDVNIPEGDNAKYVDDSFGIDEIKNVATGKVIPMDDEDD